jgi:hypothetical protein
MSDPKKRRKPTGKTGPVRVESSRGSTKVDFLPIHFPNSKAEIEKFIVKSFLSAVPNHLLIAPFVDIQPNQENDFDFVDLGAKRPTYIELMEIAPLENIRGSYNEAPASYKVHEFAEALLLKILAKSTRYNVSADTRPVLLTYVTDWRFTLSSSVVALIQYWTLIHQHVFSEIYTFKPISSSDGSITRRIYPTPREYWIGFNPDTLQDNEVYNLDPERIRPFSEE